MSKYQAIAYIRISYTDDKSKESDSVVNQKRLIEDFAAAHPDITLVGEKTDDGYSGVIFDRPAFKEMMQEVIEGKINCVIVKDLSRLGRDYIETGRYLRRIFPAYGVRFIAVNDHIDTLNESVEGDLTVSVKNILNDAYCHDISIKTRSALAAKRRNGEFVGSCTVYGYAKSPDNKNRLVIDETAAAVVQDIFRMKLEGTSAVRIAEELNRLGVLSPMEYKRQNGIPHPTGGYADKADAKWSATTIIRMLKDEIYTGVLIQGKQGTPNHKVKEITARPENQWFRTEYAHDPIIRKNDFDLVQRIINLDTRTAPGENKVYFFSGILICGCCGGRMTRKTVSAQGRKYFYYHCPTGKKGGCRTPMLKESRLAACVLDSLKAHINNVVSLDELMNACGTSVLNQKLIRQHMKQMIQNRKIIEKNNHFKSKLYENLVGGALSKPEYTSYKSKYDAAIGLLEEANTGLECEIGKLSDNTSERLKWMEHFKRFRQLEALDRRAVIQLIQSVVVKDKTHIEITYNYHSEYEKAVAMAAARPVMKEAV